MSLPSGWVEPIFTKLTLIYGQQFLRRWQDLNIEAVKADWAHELSGLDKSPKRIAWALQNLPIDQPPTVLQFRALAWKMPAEETTLLELKQHRGSPMPESVRVQIAKLKSMVTTA